MGTSAQAAKPTSRQLAYIRDLNARTGTDFIYPRTIGRARREIERLSFLIERQDLAIKRFSELAENAGLPSFDEVQRDGTALRFLWNDSKVMVVIDLEDDPTDPGAAAANADAAIAA